MYSLHITEAQQANINFTMQLIWRDKATRNISNDLLAAMWTARDLAAYDIAEEFRFLIEIYWRLQEL